MIEQTPVQIELDENADVLTALADGVMFRWFIDGELVSEGPSNEIAFQEGGTFLVRVEVVLANGCILVSEEQEFMIITSTETIQHLTFWEATPNPVEDILTVHLTTDRPQMLSLTILNTAGMVIRKQTQEVQGQAKYSIDMEELASGIYLLTLSDGNAIQTQKIVKQ